MLITSGLFNVAREVISKHYSITTSLNVVCCQLHGRRNRLKTQRVRE